jgi:hypothetical protein
MEVHHIHHSPLSIKEYLSMFYAFRQKNRTTSSDLFRKS